MNYDELRKHEPAAGDALALRGTTGEYEYVITGEVAGTALEDAPEPDARVLRFAVDEFLEIRGEGLTQAREYLVDLPPVQHYLGEDPRPAPLPALVYREDLPLGVSLPKPTFRGSRVSWYDTSPEGTPVDFHTGEMVDTSLVLPERSREVIS
jgi:hypothetical protein